MSEEGNGDKKKKKTGTKKHEESMLWFLRTAHVNDVNSPLEDKLNTKKSFFDWKTFIKWLTDARYWLDVGSATEY